MLPLLWLLKYTRMTGSALYDVTFAGGLPGCDNLLSKNFLSVSTGRVHSIPTELYLSLELN